MNIHTFIAGLAAFWALGSLLLAAFYVYRTVIKRRENPFGGDDWYATWSIGAIAIGMMFGAPLAIIVLVLIQLIRIVFA